MKIRYRRTGGIANLKTQFEFDSESLPPEKLSTLKSLLKGKSSGKSTSSDDFIHELEVMEGASHITRRFTDSQSSSAALELFDYLVHAGTKKTSRS